MKRPQRRDNRPHRGHLLLVRAVAVRFGPMNPRSTILPCPNCRQLLRVPTNRGELILTCPLCRTRWDWLPPQAGGPGEQATRATPPVAEPRADRAGPGGRVTDGPMKFSDFVVRGTILTDLQATTKEGAIREMVRSLHRAALSRRRTRRASRAGSWVVRNWVRHPQGFKGWPASRITTPRSSA